MPKNIQAAKKILRNLTDTYLLRNKVMENSFYRYFTTYKQSLLNVCNSIFQKNVIK